MQDYLATGDYVSGPQYLPIHEVIKQQYVF